MKRKGKKNNRILGLCVFVTMLLMTLGTRSKAVGKSELKLLWYETNDYPITTESDEWYDFGMMDMFDILNPPCELLESYSTSKLADLMLSYPYLWVLPSYDFENRFLFFRYVQESDIYNELMNRSDGITNLLKAYRNTEISIEYLNSDPLIVWRLDPKVNAEIFGCQFIRYYAESFSEDEQALVNQVMEEKMDIYSKLTSSFTRRYLSFSDMEENEDVLLADVARETEGSLRSSYGFSATGPYYLRSIETVNIWFTPGTYHKYSVYANCDLWYINGYTPAMTTALDNSIAYPWTLIDHSTPKYNCHSFAWIQDNTSNEYWMDSPLAYMNSYDVYYVGWAGYVIPQVGDIIVYYDDYTGEINHSAKVINTPSGATGYYVRSKIGGRALYDSPLDEVGAYYGSHNKYAVYR